MSEKTGYRLRIRNSVEIRLFLFRDSSNRQILILHPQSYATYFLEKREGYIDAGVQNYLRPVLKHSFKRKAYSVVVGPFGMTKSRDLICIQSLDGTLSFFDQETFLFMCLFNDIIIPAPVSYVSSSDVFVICKSTWIMEVYSYQQLREFSELGVRQNKENVPQWTYNPGEEISAMQVLRTSSNFSSIIALGERYLYCFQDNGLMKYMIRLDFSSVCFHAYLIGWYYEPNSRLLIMVVSEDRKLYIYEETALLWSCDLLYKTISISRCFIKNLSGGVVTLSTKGIVNASYLGTEPDLNSTIVSMRAAAEPKDIQTELEAVEEALKRVMDNEELLPATEVINIKIDIGKPVENFNNEFDGYKSLNCPLIVTLTCEDPTQIQTIQISYVCKYPFSVSDTTVCLDDTNGTEIVQTQIYLINDMDVSNTNIKVIFTTTLCTGKINVATRDVLIPMELFAQFSDSNELADQFKLSFATNKECISFDNFYPDHKNTTCITFSYKNNNKIVTINIMDDKYVIEANDCSEMYPILNDFLNRVLEHYSSYGNFQVIFNINADLLKQIIHRFLKSIEIHAKERIILNSLQAELNVLQSQFTLIQKKLLVQYGSLPPGECDGLEFLMRDTHSMIVKTAENILEIKEKVSSVSCEVSAIGYLLLCILKHSGIENNKMQIMEETLSFDTFNDDIQEWEESVTQASSFILNTILKKSKEREKLSPVTDQDILSHVNLKRFLKQTKLILENMFLASEKSYESVTRIEELVEVI